MKVTEKTNFFFLKILMVALAAIFMIETKSSVKSIVLVEAKCLYHGSVPKVPQKYRSGAVNEKIYTDLINLKVISSYRRL